RTQTEEDPAHPRDVAVDDVDIGEPQDQEEGRNHERDAGDDPALDLVQEPAHVDRELLGLGSGQQHAVVQGVQEPGVADPAPALHQLLVHDRDLPGGTAEVDEAELDPEHRRLTEGDPVDRLLDRAVDLLHADAEPTSSRHHAYSASYMGVSTSIFRWSS